MTKRYKPKEANIKKLLTYFKKHSENGTNKERDTSANK